MKLLGFVKVLISAFMTTLKSGITDVLFFITVNANFKPPSICTITVYVHKRSYSHLEKVLYYNKFVCKCAEGVPPHVFSLIVDYI